MQHTPTQFATAIYRPVGGMRASLALSTLALALAPAGVHAQDAVASGFRIINDRTLGNCTACHALGGQSGLRSTFGPALDKVGLRYDADTLRQWVTDARRVKPDTLMPPFGTTEGTVLADRAQPTLSNDEIAQVVAALQTLR